MVCRRRGRTTVNMLLYCANTPCAFNLDLIRLPSLDIFQPHYRSSYRSLASLHISITLYFLLALSSPRFLHIRFLLHLLLFSLPLPAGLTVQVPRVHIFSFISCWTFTSLRTPPDAGFTHHQLHAYGFMRPTAAHLDSLDASFLVRGLLLALVLLSTGFSVSFSGSLTAPHRAHASLPASAPYALFAHHRIKFTIFADLRSFWFFAAITRHSAIAQDALTSPTRWHTL